jgi:hypothetical protein
MKTLAFGEGSMKTVNTSTVVPLEKCPFRAFPSRTLCVRLLTAIDEYFILALSKMFFYKFKA